MFNIFEMYSLHHCGSLQTFIATSQWLSFSGAAWYSKCGLVLYILSGLSRRHHKKTWVFHSPDNTRQGEKPSTRAPWGNGAAEEPLTQFPGVLLLHRFRSSLHPAIPSCARRLWMILRSAKLHLQVTRLLSNASATLCCCGYDMRLCQAL